MLRKELADAKRLVKEQGAELADAKKLVQDLHDEVLKLRAQAHLINHCPAVSYYILMQESNLCSMHVINAELCVHVDHVQSNVYWRAHGRTNMMFMPVWDGYGHVHRVGQRQ